MSIHSRDLSTRPFSWSWLQHGKLQAEKQLQPDRVSKQRNNYNRIQTTSNSNRTHCAEKKTKKNKRSGLRTHQANFARQRASFAALSLRSAWPGLEQNLDHLQVALDAGLACSDRRILQKWGLIKRFFTWLWVKNRVTPRWLALVSGNMDQNLRCPGGLILTHTHMGWPLKDTTQKTDDCSCGCGSKPMVPFWSK